MMSLKLVAFISCLFTIVAYTYAQIAPGSNTYLPPKTTKSGYNYPSPPVPFPTKPSRPGPSPTRPPVRPPPGQGRTLPPGPGEPGHVHMPGNPFDFQYRVNDAETSNDYSHKAKSDGDVTNGEYRVQLPDGRTQVVRYTADWKTGYHAEVSYEGQAQFPQGPPIGGRPGGGYRY